MIKNRLEMAVKSGFGIVLTHGELMDILGLIDRVQTSEVLMRIENPQPVVVEKAAPVEPTPVKAAPVEEREPGVSKKKYGKKTELDLDKELTKLGDAKGADFYKFIQYLNINRGYTYKAIAEAVGCTDTSICNWVNKSQKMSSKMWDRISSVDPRLADMRAGIKTRTYDKKPLKTVTKKKEATRRIKMDDASTSDVRYTLFNKAIKYRGTAESRLSEALSEMSDCSHSTMAKVFNMSIERYKKFRVDESIKMPRALVNMFKLYVHESTNE